MHVTLTPNVQDAVRGDPVFAVILEQLRADPRPGYLHLFRSSPRAPFFALFYEPDGTRHEGTDPVLEAAILAALR